ncbi:unnamed protein product, partial [marine sediment metagenome]
KMIICQNCNTENSELNICCWKCDEILGKENKYIKIEHEMKEMQKSYYIIIFCCIG